MGFLVECLFAILILVVLFVCMLYVCVPLPDGMETTFLLRLICGIMKLFAVKNRIQTSLGFGTRGSNMRMVRPLPQTSDDVRVEHASFDGVEVYVYTPVMTLTGKRPGMVWLHGGGWVLGSVSGYDKENKLIAKELDMVVVAVEYRLAPEHPFPVPFNDCLAATKYFLHNAAEYGVDETRIAVAGDSAGGNLAAAVTQELYKPPHTKRPNAYVMLYPALQAIDFLLPSYQQDNCPILSSDLMVYFWLAYAEGHDANQQAALHNRHTSRQLKQSRFAKYVNFSLLNEKYISDSFQPYEDDFGDDSVASKIESVVTDPRFAPLMQDNLENLPPAFVLTCEYDPLRDDGLLYVQRLEEAKVKVTHVHLPSAIHGAYSFASLKLKTGEKTAQSMKEFLRKNV